MNNYKDVLDEARLKFNVVGVLGMTYSGTSTLLHRIWKHPLLVVTNQSGLFNHVVDMFNLKNESIHHFFNKKGIQLDVDENGHMIYCASNTKKIESEFYSDNMLTEEIEEIYNTVFDFIMSELSVRVRNIMDKNPNITKNLNVPLFIELPYSTIVNYNDLVDEIITVERPNHYDENIWYMKNMIEECDFNPMKPDVCPGSYNNGVITLQKLDSIWNKLNYTSNTVIRNDKDLLHFDNLISDTVSQYVQSFVSKFDSRID